MYWQQRFDRDNPDEELENKISEIFVKSNKTYGYRRITGEIRKDNTKVNSKKVRRIMKKLELKCVAFSHKSRKYNSYRGTVGKTFKNIINRRFNTSIPHQKVTTDTTEFKIYSTGDNGKLSIEKAYLNPFLDMFNGEILSFTLSKRPTFGQINDALNKAIEVTNDCP